MPLIRNITSGEFKNGANRGAYERVTPCFTVQQRPLACH